MNSRIEPRGSSIINFRAKEDYVKTVEDYMYELDPQVASDLVTPQEDIEEEYILYNDPVYNWGAARTAVNSKLSLFSSSDIESAQVGKTMLKQWRRYQDTEFTIEKHLTTLKQIPKRDAVMDVDIN